MAPEKGGGCMKSFSKVSSPVFFLLLILQIPLFSARLSLSPYIRWRGVLNPISASIMSGMCLTPIHVTSSQLIAREIIPVPVVKALLYPGAIAGGLITQKTVPSWDDLSLTRCVLVGSYFAVAGAFAGILKPGRMSMFGTLLIMWGLAKDGILGKSANPDSSRSVSVYPTMGIALICALSSIKYNMKKATRPAPARTLAKPLQSSSKSKLK